MKHGLVTDCKALHGVTQARQWLHRWGRCPSWTMVKRLVWGTLGAQERAWVEEHMEHCRGCRWRREAIEQEAFGSVRRNLLALALGQEGGE